MNTLAPPEELAGADLVALVLPFDEDVNPLHEEAPLRYTWIDVRLPRKPLPLREVHDGREIGLLDGFVKDRTGIWARLKPGKTASTLIARGYAALSAELDDGEITGVALVAPGETPGFASARIYTAQGAVLDAPEAALRFGLSSSTGLLGSRPPSTTSEPDAIAQLPSMVIHRPYVPDPQAEVERARVAFERRQEELAEQVVLDEELRLVAAGVPVPQWPENLPRRRAYDAMVERWRAEEVAAEAARERKEQQAQAERVRASGVRASREFGERMHGLEVRAERARRRWRWWRR